MTVAGTVEDFDALAFTEGLAASIGVPAARISLDVSAASVSVVATIRVADAADAAATAAAIDDAIVDTAALGTALGVTVEAIEAPAFATIVLPTPSPPPQAATPPPATAPSPPPSNSSLIALEALSSTNDAEGQGVVIALAVSLPIALVLAVLMGACLWRRRHAAAHSGLARATRLPHEGAEKAGKQDDKGMSMSVAPSALPVPNVPRVPDTNEVVASV